MTPPALRARLAELPATARLLGALDGLAPAHVVGGTVRDLLLGRAPGDLDLVVEDDPEALARALATRLGGAVRTHDRFGTATVQAPGLRFDVARARTERYPAPGALPVVEPADLDADLRRRDFTVNALAVALDPRGAGALRAVPGALDDLAAGRLRVLHDDSFADDPTRLLRMVRYAARLDFTPEPHTRALAEAAIAAGALATVSGPRIGSELRSLFDHEGTVGALALLRDLRLDEALGPGLHADPTLAERALALLPADGRRDVLALGACGVNADREALGAWLTHAGMPATDAATVLATAAAPALADRLAGLESGAAIGAVLAAARPETVALAGALGAERPARRWLDDLRHRGLSIRGDDLVAAGVPQGPAVGRGLQAALAARLDGAPPDRDRELATALAAVRDHESSED